MATFLNIERVTFNDLNTLRKISIQTFTDAFAAFNTPEDMQQYISESFSLEKLSEELNDAGASFYFALDGSKVIGYLKINTGNSQTDLKAPDSLEIERIYVLQDYHGKQVGQRLYEKAIEVAQQYQATYVWLGVWEKNEKAIRFYEKNGFVPFDTYVFMLGADAQTDILMKKLL